MPQAYALANASSNRYLSTTGSDTNNDCTQLSTPCRTWQHSLNNAQTGDTVLAAAGTYTDLTVSGNFTQVAVISQSITIQGGYDAVFSQPPDPAANPTILDAQGEGRVLTIQNAAQVTINGLQITGGSTSGQNDYGGGLYAINTDVTLTDSIIRQNTAGYGGGIYLQHSQVLIQNSEISENKAQFSGGGIRCYDCTGIIEQNKLISNTSVSYGGGFDIKNSPLMMTDNSVQNNRVSSLNFGWGGGGQIHDSQAHLIRNTISDNSAYNGGGLRLIGSAATLQGNIFQNNQAASGGGLTLETTSHASLENNAFVANTASMNGDGIYIKDVQPVLQHTTFNSNGETAVFVEGSATVNMGNSLIANQTNGIINNGAAVTLTTTLWDNVTTYTQGSVQETNTINGSAGFTADGYHITAVSDALNNATNANTKIDIDNQPRPQGSSSDIGADEWASLTAIKQASDYFIKPGLTVTYTITLTNELPVTTTIQLTDTLPAQLDYLGPISASSGSANYSNGAVLWQGSLSEQESVTISWPVSIHTNLQPGTTITNSAIVQNEHGIFDTTTAVMVVPSEVYLPLVSK